MHVLGDWEMRLSPSCQDLILHIQMDIAVGDICPPTRSMSHVRESSEKLLQFKNLTLDAAFMTATDIVGAHVIYFSLL